MPRLVTAGVPIRMPLATIGGFWSNGMAFLLTVIPALPSAASATLPVRPFEKTSTSIRWLSVPPRHEPEAGIGQAGGEPPGVGDDLLLVVRRTRLERFLEADRLGGDDVHQRPALDAGEQRSIEVLGVLRAAQHHAAARAAQRLVRRRGHEVGVRHRARMHLRGDEPGDVRHVGDHRRADVAPDLADALEVDDPRIGAGADHDHLRLVLVREPLELVVVDALVVSARTP